MNLHVIPWIRGNTSTWVYDGPDHIATLFRFFDEIEVFLCVNRAYEFLCVVRDDEEAKQAIIAHFVWKRVLK